MSVVTCTKADLLLQLYQSHPLHIKDKYLSDCLILTKKCILLNNFEQKLIMTVQSYERLGLEVIMPTYKIYVQVFIYKKIYMHLKALFRDKENSHE